MQDNLLTVLCPFLSLLVLFPFKQHLHTYSIILLKAPFVSCTAYSIVVAATASMSKHDWSFTHMLTPRPKWFQLQNAYWIWCFQLDIAVVALHVVIDRSFILKKWIVRALLQLTFLKIELLPYWERWFQEFDHWFFDQIARFCDRKIDSIMKKIESRPSIFFKDRRDWFVHDLSFSFQRSPRVNYNTK